LKKINLARAFVQLGNSAEGEKLLLQISTNSSSESYIEANVLLGKFYSAKQDYAKSQYYYELSIQDSNNIINSPIIASAYAGLGKLCMVRDQNYIKSKEYLSMAIAINPNDEKIYFDYSISLLYNNQKVSLVIKKLKKKKIN
jgi:tetratricopeptide (TPR) repeat protein